MVLSKANENLRMPEMLSVYTSKMQKGEGVGSNVVQC